jgi:outer membrane protein TolC
MRWIPASAALALCVAILSGCERQVFLNQKDFDSATNQFTAMIEKDPGFASQPVVHRVEAPPSVDLPDREPRYLSLSEAIAIALENGTPSSGLIGPDGDNIGQSDQGLVALNRGNLGQFVNQTDRLKVLALNPALAYNSIEAQESRFDPKWITTANWTVTDQLTNGLNNFNNGESAAFNSSIVKTLASGGVANITFNTNYTNLSNPPTVGTFRVINPLYNVPVNFGIEQPLLRDFGVRINQLLNQAAPIQGVTMPLQAANYYNNSRLPLTQGGLTQTGINFQGILVARLTFDANRAEFQRQIHALLLNTEAAYWKLYQAYGNLYAYEQVLRLAHKSWWLTYENFKAGRLGPQEYYPVLAQYEEFRGERIKALGGILEAERNLRGIMGIQVEDGYRLVPVTAPTLARYLPNWQAAEEDALDLRPELVMARQNIKNAQFNLEIQKNFMRPDLRLVGQYTPVGFGTTLDGRGTLVDGTGQTRTSNAFASLGGGSFNNWTVGLTFNVPLGYRLESAALRSARLALAQGYYFLEDQEQKAQRTLAKHYQKIPEWYHRIEIARDEREGYADSVKSYWEAYKLGVSTTKAGQTLTALLLSLIQYQRSMALAQLKEYEAITEYNNTLARFEWAKGTIMQHDNVQIAEGPLPHCVQIRAVENERQRTRALVLNERPAATPVSHPAMLAADPTVPMELTRPPTTDAPEKLDAGRQPTYPVIRAPQNITPPRTSGSPITMPESGVPFGHTTTNTPKTMAPPKTPRLPSIMPESGAPFGPTTTNKEAKAPAARPITVPPTPISPAIEPKTPTSPTGNGGNVPGMLPEIPFPPANLPDAVQSRDVPSPSLPPTAAPGLPVMPPTAPGASLDPVPPLSSPEQR